MHVRALSLSLQSLFCHSPAQSSSMHCSIMATNMSVWMDTDHQLWCVLAVDSLHFWTPIPTMQLFHMIWYDCPVVCVALPGIAAHFFHGELLFSHMFTVPFYGLQFWMKLQKQWNWHLKHCAFLYICRHLMVTFISTCGLLSDVYSFPVLQHFWSKGSCRDS